MATTLNKKKALQGLSLTIALCRYDMTEAIYSGVPVGLLGSLATEICSCQIVMRAVRDDRVEGLPLALKSCLIPYYE